MMLLRSKAGTGNQASAPVEAKKRKQEVSKGVDEPMPKKSISDISSGMKMFAIDSTKRENRPPTTITESTTDFDFDREEAHNMDAVSDFADDIFKYYKSREKDFRVGDYLSSHPEVDMKTRAILVDWLVELQETFELNHETLYNSVKLVDLYLSRSENVTRDDIQKVASAAIYISAKFDERSPPLADDLCYLSGDRFAREDLMEMERKLFEVVGFDLGAPLSYRYLRRLARVTRTGMAELTLARYILETTLLVYDFSLLAASKVAAGAFLLAMRMKDKAFVWNAVLVKYSGYSADEVEPLVAHINHTMHYVTKTWKQLRNIRDKYAHEVFHKVADMQLLPDTLAKKRDVTLPQFSFP